MEGHVKILGILHIVFGGLGLLAAVGLLLLFGGIAGVLGTQDYSSDAHISIPILGGIAAFIFIFLAAISLPGVIAGIGLLQFQPWARILTIVLSVIELIHIPFGTALGVYGMWVLLSQDGERLFRRA